MSINDQDAREGYGDNVVIKVTFGKRAAAAPEANAVALDRDIDELDMDDVQDTDPDTAAPFDGFELDTEAPLDVSGRMAFGVELPAGRNDMVASIAALTQLMSIADEQGVDTDSSLSGAIATLRHSLEGASVVLPPQLLELLDMIAPLETVSENPDGTPNPSGAPQLRLVD
jgi:hypothetical protein